MPKRKKQQQKKPTLFFWNRNFNMFLFDSRINTKNIVKLMFSLFIESIRIFTSFTKYSDNTSAIQPKSVFPRSKTCLEGEPRIHQPIFAPTSSTNLGRILTMSAKLLATISWPGLSKLSNNSIAKQITELLARHSPFVSMSLSNHTH